MQDFDADLVPEPDVNLQIQKIYIRKHNLKYINFGLRLDNSESSFMLWSYVNCQQNAIQGNMIYPIYQKHNR